jgi:Ca2+-transporting ATPase
MRVVKLLKENNNSVVVTGDGINDAPALKAADVGVAMGIAGTEVSKEAADIVLLDDSFSTIVNAIKWGRGIYENFQRFIQFQLTVNVVAFVTVILAELLGFRMPFTTLQLLWVNIIMDGPPALTLGLEPPREHLLEKQPIKRNASIVTKDMLFKILTNGLFIVTALLMLMETQALGGTDAQQSTIVFTSFVLFQLWNAFNSREFGVTSIFPNLLRNKVMVGVVFLTFLVQILVTQYGGQVFKTVSLEMDLWFKIIGFTFSVVIFSELLKLLMRAFRGIFSKKAT